LSFSIAAGGIKSKEASVPRSSKTDKIEQSHYAMPDELIEDRDLSLEEKMKALKVIVNDGVGLNPRRLRATGTST
jgi:hypothetical protein